MKTVNQLSTFPDVFIPPNKLLKIDDFLGSSAYNPHIAMNQHIAFQSPTATALVTRALHPYERPHTWQMPIPGGLLWPHSTSVQYRPACVPVPYRLWHRADRARRNSLPTADLYETETAMTRLMPPEQPSYFFIEHTSHGFSCRQCREQPDPA